MFGSLFSGGGEEAVFTKEVTEITEESQKHSSKQKILNAEVAEERRGQNVLILLRKMLAPLCFLGERGEAIFTTEVTESTEESQKQSIKLKLLNAEVAEKRRGQACVALLCDSSLWTL